MTNLQKQIEISKLTLIKGGVNIQKSHLELFYCGWNCLLPMNKGDNFIVYKAKNYRDVQFWVKQAEERIADKKLPLKVIGIGEVSNTFIIQNM